MIRIYALAILLLSAACSAMAQSGLPCGTPKAWNELVRRHPEAEQRRQELNQATRRLLQNPVARSTQDDDSVLVIPVVVHIIHNYGAENISDAQVEDFIRVINADFSKTSWDTSRVSATFKPIQANVRFEFRLARRDPNGNCTIGITRTVSPLTMDGDDRVKDLVRWPNQKYLNVWVVNYIEGAGAYAYYPGAGPTWDGIVCRYTQFGSIGASAGGNGQARTMTHEIGHYFNLAHTWGDSNEPGSSANCSMDDDVDDTPNTVGTSDGSCPLNVHTCGETLPDNVENYMDYSGCGRMFTLGQKARMRAAAYASLSGRNNLWSAQNLAETGTATRTGVPVCPPTVALPPIAYKVCPGQQIRFSANLNNSLVSQTNFLWELPGSNQTTSTDPYPRVTYVTPGVFPVRLKVFNAAGRDSAMKDSSIVVRNPAAFYTPIDSETFAAPTFPIVSTQGDQFWEMESPDGRRGWYRSQASGATDQTSLSINLGSLATGNKYSAISPAFDLSNLPRPVYLVFRYGATRRVSSARDELAVYVSNNCGTNWNVRVRRSYSTTPRVYTQLASQNGTWVAGPADYVEQRINLDPYVGRNSVRFKFEVKAGGGGNAIYLDNVKVVAGPTAVSDRELLKDISIAPNPASTLVEVELGSWPEQKPVAYELISPLGQRVLAGKSEGNRFVMDVSALAKGVYLLSLEGQKVQRIVVE